VGQATCSSDSTRFWWPHLLDDGSRIQVRRGVVSSCADNLDAAGVSLVVRLGPHECREKTVVDVDGVLPVLVAEVLGQDLHVPCQHNEVDRFLLQDLLNLRTFEAMQDRELVDTIFLRPKQRQKTMNHRDTSQTNEKQKRSTSPLPVFSRTYLDFLHSFPSLVFRRDG